MNTPTPSQIFADPTSSYWLKDVLRSALARDPVDAADDAAMLAEILGQIAYTKVRDARRGF